MKKNPPLGVKPLEVWRMERIEDLARAIYEYIKSGLYEGYVYRWISELEELKKQVSWTIEDDYQYTSMSNK